MPTSQKQSSSQPPVEAAEPLSPTPKNPIPKNKSGEFDLSNKNLAFKKMATDDVVAPKSGSGLFGLPKDKASEDNMTMKSKSTISNTSHLNETKPKGLFTNEAKHD